MTARRSAVRGAAATLAAIVASVALVAQGGVTTDASWIDQEFTHGAVRTVDCAAAEGDFASRGEGRLLSGSLLGIDLDRIAAVQGTVVTNDGARSRPHGDAAPVGDSTDAYSDPLTVEALSAVNVALPGVLQLPLDTDLGLVGQYAQARSDGRAIGAAGVLTPSGGIAADRHGDYPELARLSLSKLLAQIDPTVAATLGDVTDVSLVAGAMTGRAQVDGCGLAWSGAVSEIERDYLATSLRTDITSPTVGALVRGVSGAVDELQLAVDGLGSNGAVTNGIARDVTALLNRALGDSSVVQLGGVGSVRLSADVDLLALRSLVARPFGDADGLVRVDPATGTISVDTAALLTAAYPQEYSDGLNGLHPNTNIMSDRAMIGALTAALRAALTAWVADVEAALATALGSVRVAASTEIQVRVSTGGLIPVWEPAAIRVSIDRSLADLLGGGATPTLTVEAGLLGHVITPLLSGLLAALNAGFGGIVGTAVDAALSPLGTLPDEVTALVDPIVTAVSTAYSTLFVSGVVAVTVNAQNRPAAGGAQPHDWASLPDGRFDVAALRIAVLDALGSRGARLYLGRGSVGPGCLLAQAPEPCAAY